MISMNRKTFIPPPPPSDGLLRDLLGREPALNLDRLSSLGAVFCPPYDLKETRDDFVFKADLPGLQQQDVDIELTADQLTISGERSKDLGEESDFYFAMDRTFGCFSLTFRLPENVDNDRVDALLEDGVLTIKMPKAPGLPPRSRVVSVAKGH